jgi:hypothetical protein
MTTDKIRALFVMAKQNFNDYRANLKMDKDLVALSYVNFNLNKGDLP